MVTTLADTAVADGACSLREAITNANANAATSPDCPAGTGADTITFSLSGDITLSAALPNITDPAGLVVDGAGQTISVNGNGAVRPFMVNAGALAELRALRVTAGADGQGGGLHNAGTLVITNSTVSENAATSGGGVFNTGVLVLSGAVIHQNAAVGGGGVFNQAGGLLVASNSTISNHTQSIHGGGLYNAGNASLTNVTLSGNFAALLGGGVYSTGISNLTHVTVAGNASGFNGGGLFNSGGSLNVGNSVVGLNSATVGPDCNGAVNATAPNVIERTTGCNVTGVSPIRSDPKLGPLAGNGGGTQTRALLPGSPALDAGNAAICAAAPVSAKDQRTVTRPQGPACDLGAYETQRLTINDIGQTEGSGGTTAFSFSVTLSSAVPAGATVSVHYQTANGTAIAPGDYTAVADTVLTFAAGESAKPVTVQVAGDTLLETAETFTVALSNATNAAIADAQGVATILDDDGADIHVTPASLGFGNQGVTVPSNTQAVTVQNTGSGPLNLGTISLTGPNAADFQKSADTCSGQAVPPAGQCTLAVAFTPSALGARAATLVVPSNDPDENPLNVPLSGTGVTVGGKNFTIATGSIDLRWDSGMFQTGYTLLKYNTSSTAADLITLPGGATSYSDTTAVNGVLYCYVLAATGPGGLFVALSDLLCGMTGLEGGTTIPRDFALKLGQSTNATMTWTAPVGGADSYVLQVIPLDGSPVTNLVLGGGLTTATQPMAPAGACFVLIGIRSGGSGTSNLLCGIPGISTLAGRAAALHALQGVVSAMRWPQGVLDAGLPVAASSQENR